MSAIAVGVGAGVAGVAGLAGAAMSASAAGNAADMQSASEQQALAFQQQQWAQQQQNEQPYLQAGAGALSSMQQMTAAGAPQFTQQDFLANQDPAYGFDMQQGINSIQASAAANGGLMSGGTLTALNNYAQGQASNEYQNAYSRFMNNQNTQFSRLSGIAGMGQGAVSSLGQLGSQYASAAGNAVTGSANAQAAGAIGSANAYGGALGTIGSSAAQMPGQIAGLNYLNKLTTGLPSGGMPGGGTPMAGGLQMPELGSSAGFSSSAPSLLTSFAGG